MNAELLSDWPLCRMKPDGRHLEETVVADLGRLLEEIHAWDAERPEDLFTPIACTFATGTTVLRAAPGLVYDGASLPMSLLVRILAGPKERYELAGLFHDLLYQLGLRREVADLVFWIIARSGPQSVGPFRGWLTWAALRCFGWAAWRKWRRQRERAQRG